MRRNGYESGDADTYSLSSAGSLDLHDPSDLDPMVNRKKRKDKKLKRQQKALTSLQLPQLNYKDTPTIRILVVADVDLHCASALAEAALVSTADNPLRKVDLCIACGPFCKEDELNIYYHGRQRTLRVRPTPSSHYNNETLSSSSSSLQYRYHHNHHQQQVRPQLPLITSPYKQQNFHDKPIKRSLEENAALEGLMTAALSQLESIVCRVLYIPGETDPIFHKMKRRLTPNSRNIHQQWMPLCPGLGCAGLLHLDWGKYEAMYGGDGIDEEDEDNDDDEEEDEDDNIDDSQADYGSDSELMDSYRHDDNINQSLPPLEDNIYSDSEGEASSIGSESDMPPLTDAVPSDSRTTGRQYSLDHCNSLEKLVNSAPNMNAVTDTPLANQTHPTIVGFHKTELFQTILVTHYEHLAHNNGDSHHADEELPCLPAQHDDFCDLPEVQEHVCLEIASGRNVHGEAIAPKCVSKGPNLTVLLPGSLKERGDYCLLDLAYVVDGNNGCKWSVTKSEFLRL
ncbi:unnamed protein product [Cylindrotheca closterium]|uniref:Uncharacterized protein n=1 Tax=Cylindrotheca closterium TaxID=2856 RepID=A0AAD2CHS6_9STRA|nr:unnamed protein product [Cylindrotheca closterium]